LVAFIDGAPFTPLAMRTSAQPACDWLV